MVAIQVINPMNLVPDHIFINIDIDENSLIFNDQVNKYFYVLNKEIDEVLASLDLSSEIKTIYLATSSDISDFQDLLIDLLTKLNNKLNYADDLEISVEIYPNSNWDYSELALAKVNRLVIKQYSFSESNLAYLGLEQNEFNETVKSARLGGIDNISVDLLYNFPGESKAELSILIESDIKHVYISDASLVLDFEYEDNERQLYHFIVEELEEHVYEHYELFALAKPGYESKHNLTYWNQKEYLAFGASAAGYLNNTRFRNPDYIDEYFERVLNKHEYIVDEVITDISKKQEYFILSLNKKSGFSRAEYIDKFASDWSKSVDELLNKLVEEDLLQHTDNRYSISKKGLDYVDLIMSEFFVDNLFK